MKLLQKADIAKKKAAERQQDIDEGLKIARRVDGLRETLADEEESLRNFRDVTVGTIHEEISKLGRDRDELKAEIATLIDERNQALIPLDEEWNTVNFEKDQLEQATLELNEERAAIALQSLEHDRREKLIADKEARAASEAERAQKLLLEADDDRAKAKVALKNARASELDALSYKQSVEEELEARVANVVKSEENLSASVSEIEKREHDVWEREVRIKDREETLARNLERYGGRERS